MANQSWPPLTLLTRQGCCLCEGLQERLEALDPAPPLQCVDVDGDGQLLGNAQTGIPDQEMQARCLRSHAARRWWPTSFRRNCCC